MEPYGRLDAFLGPVLALVRTIGRVMNRAARLGSVYQYPCMCPCSIPCGTEGRFSKGYSHRISSTEHRRTRGDFRRGTLVLPKSCRLFIVTTAIIAAALALPAGICNAAGAEYIYNRAKPATVFIRSDLKLQLKIPRAHLDSYAIKRNVRSVLDRLRKSDTPENISKAVRFLLDEYPEKHVIVGSEVKPAEHTTSSTGTGFFVSPSGHIVTNAHVVGYVKKDVVIGILKSMSKDKVGRDLLRLRNSIPELDRIDDYEFRKLVISAAVAIAKVCYEHTRIGGQRLIRVALPRKPPNVVAGKVLHMGKPYPGKDVAIVKVPGEGYPYLSLEDHNRVGVGGEVFAVGFPGAAFQSGMDGESLLEATITSGIVSAKKKSSEGWPILQMDAAISPGNSGGPAMSRSGGVIGIATACAVDRDSGQNVEGIHFVIPSGVVREFLRDARVQLASHRPQSEPAGDVLEWAKKGDPNRVERALKSGADVNARDGEYGGTPLHWAAYGGHTRVVRVLLEHGADINSLNRDGRTPLILAAGKGHKRVVKLLLDRGADKTMRDGSGKDAMHYAATMGGKGMIRLLKGR